MSALLHLNEIPYIMGDAYLCDERRSLLFLSVWGRDTAIQELLARLTLKGDEGLSQLTFISQAQHEHLLFPGNNDNLDKRTSRHSRTRFGELIHLWLFDKRCLEPDRASGQAFLLLERDSPDWCERVWLLLRETTSLPLLDHWRDFIIHELQASGMLMPVAGFGPLTGWQLTLDTPQLTDFISHGITTRVFTTDAKASGDIRQSCHAA